MDVSNETLKFDTIHPCSVVRKYRAQKWDFTVDTGAQHCASHAKVAETGTTV